MTRYLAFLATNCHWVRIADVSQRFQPQPYYELVGRVHYLHRCRACRRESLSEIDYRTMLGVGSIREQIYEAGSRKNRHNRFHWHASDQPVGLGHAPRQGDFVPAVSDVLRFADIPSSRSGMMRLRKLDLCLPGAV
jgi:hypothetical protein